MRRAPRPLFIVCANPRCRRVHAVRRPAEQRRIRFCSHRCAATMIHNLTREGSRRGGLSRARHAQQRLLEQLVGLTPLEAFRRGYDRGLQSKLRQIRRKYVLVKRSEAA